MKKQVEKEHYEFLSYIDMERWCSYYRQICEIIKSGKKEFVLIGVGDGIVPSLVNKIDPTIKFITVDFDQDLKPDICCDILQLSKHFKGKTEAVICCQVLEHLPFGDFSKALKEISRILEEDGILILSLPDGGLDMGAKIKLPKLAWKNISRRFCRIYKQEFEFNGEHYWEINGARKYSLKIIRKKISSIFEICQCYSVPNNSYHKFFVCKKKDKDATRT